jgi:hypothetical protein
MRAVYLVAAAAVLLSACGGEEQPAAPPAPSGTHLVVEVRPEGDKGPVERRTFDALPPGITVSDLDPVPADKLCTELYGGPETAHVTGTIDGKPVDARFKRTNGCEIARWNRVRALLGSR